MASRLFGIESTVLQAEDECIRQSCGFFWVVRQFEIYMGSNRRGAVGNCEHGKQTNQA